MYSQPSFFSSFRVESSPSPPRPPRTADQAFRVRDDARAVPPVSLACFGLRVQRTATTCRLAVNEGPHSSTRDRRRRSDTIAIIYFTQSAARVRPVVTVVIILILFIAAGSVVFVYRPFPPSSSRGR